MYKILTKFIGKFHARVRKTSAYPREFGERQLPTRRAAAAADAQAAPRGRAKLLSGSNFASPPPLASTL